MNDSSDKNTTGASAMSRALMGKSADPAQQASRNAIAPAADAAVYVLDENQRPRFQITDQDAA